VGHLDELHAKYRDKGLVVVAVTDEGRSLVDKFVSTTGAKHPILIESSDSATAYNINGFPSTFLIDVNGKVAWAGNGAGFPDSLLEKLLGEVRLTPELPKSMDSIRKSLEKHEYAPARKALEAKGSAPGVAEDERKAAEEAVKWIDRLGEMKLSSAEDDRKGGDAWAAADSLRRVVTEFKGLEASDKAKAALDAILADKDLKREVDAGDSWAKLEERLKALKPEPAIQGCRQFAKKWEGTKAAAKAEAAATRIEAKERKR
jgi:AhpC/TSA family protein